MATTKQTKRQPSIFEGLALAHLANLAHAFKSHSGDGEAISQLRDELSELNYTLRPQSAEQIAEKLGDVCEDEGFHEGLRTAAVVIGWGFEHGRKIREANLSLEGQPAEGVGEANG